MNNSLIESLQYSPLKKHRDIYWHVRVMHPLHCKFARTLFKLCHISLQNKDTYYDYRGGIPTDALGPIVRDKQGGMLVPRASFDLWKKEIAEYLDGSYPLEVNH